MPQCCDKDSARQVQMLWQHCGAACSYRHIMGAWSPCLTGLQTYKRFASTKAALLASGTRELAVLTRYAIVVPPTHPHTPPPWQPGKHNFNVSKPDNCNQNWPACKTVMDLWGTGTCITRPSIKAFAAGQRQAQLCQLGGPRQPEIVFASGNLRLSLITAKLCRFVQAASVGHKASLDSPQPSKCKHDRQGILLIIHNAPASPTSAHSVS